MIMIMIMITLVGQLRVRLDVVAYSAAISACEKARQFREPPLGHVDFVWGWKPSFIISRFWAFAGPRLFLCRSNPPTKKSKATPSLI